MGKITELSQGNLDGLKKQVCECIENAYNRGYADGKKEPIESHGEQEYNRGIEDASNLLAYTDKRFIRECFPSESNWDLFDLNAKYGLAVVIKEFKEWQVKINQTEKEIKVGDEVITFGGSKAIVTRVEDTNIRLFYSDGSGGRFDNNVEIIEKTGRNFSAEVSQLLDKLKGDK